MPEGLRSRSSWPGGIVWYQAGLCLRALLPLCGQAPCEGWQPRALPLGRCGLMIRGVEGQKEGGERV